MHGAAGTEPAPTGLPTRYRLGAVVGRGGSATVWSARDTRTGCDVVVKVLDGPASPVAQFDAEVRALGRLAGVPGVVEVQAVGTTVGGRPWLVEELVVGPTLAARLRSAPWSPAEVQRLVRDVASTLAAAHAAGVVHGDMAPANVLCRPTGAFVVCDFGVSVLGGPPTGASPCTPSFAAPERLAGGPPTPAADVYGLGVLGWYALVGALPPARMDAARGLPRRLSDVLARMLHDEPGQRPTASAVARRAR